MFPLRMVCDHPKSIGQTQLVQGTGVCLPLSRLRLSRHEEELRHIDNSPARERENYGRTSEVSRRTPPGFDLIGCNSSGFLFRIRGQRPDM
jgi:hypothetical protein